MSHLLGTLLCVNGQILAFSRPVILGNRATRPPGGNLKRADARLRWGAVQRHSRLRRWWKGRRQYPLASKMPKLSLNPWTLLPSDSPRTGLAMPLNAGEDRSVSQPSTLKRIVIKGLASLMALAMVGFLVFMVLGIQEVNHTRERIRWSRQLKEREQEVHHLARERHNLRGMIALRSMEIVPPNTPPTTFAGTPPSPPPKKRTL